MKRQPFFAIFHTVFDSCSAFFTLNRTEMLATQAMKLKVLASGLAWENSQHFTATYNWFPWEIMSEVWLMTCHNPDLGSASDWLKQISLVVWPLTIRSTTQIWVVEHHQYGISAKVCTVLKSPWILGEVLEKSLNSIFPWKVLKFLCKSLKRAWIFFNFECSSLERIFWCFLVVQDRI